MLALRAAFRSESFFYYNTCQQRGRKRGRHARHQLDGHAGCGQGAQLAADAREDGRAAALQPHHPAPLHAESAQMSHEPEVQSHRPGHAGWATKSPP